MLESKVEMLKKEGVLPKMMFNNILISAEKNRPVTNLIVPGMSDNVYSTYQTVIDVGPGVSNIQVGDIVQIKVENFFVRKLNNSIKQDLVKEYHEVELPVEGFGDKEYMLISDRDVKFYWRTDL